MEETISIAAILSLFNQGGVTMYVIVLCSIILTSLVLERFIYFMKMGRNPDMLLAKIANLVEQKKCDEALLLCRGEKGSPARVFAGALHREESPREEMEEAMEATIAEETLGYEGNLNHIGTIAVIAPFIGLLGTVLGIMKAFHDIAMKGGTGPDVVAKGVSEALTATAAGLFVAIPASIFFNYFKGRGRSITSKLRIAAARLAEMLTLAKAGRPLPQDLREPGKDGREE
jgi:biopolymer transport protein ExbB